LPPERVDFTVDVLRDAFQHIAEEMATELKKIAYSPIIREAGDFATGITDARGQLISRASYTPGHYNSISMSTKEVVKAVGLENIHPGDVLITNDPWICASHLPDIFVYQPLFDGDELFAFLVTGAHHIDVGGKNPGGTTANTTEIYQEGLQIPPMKLRIAGVVNDSLETIIRANVRLGHVVMNDIYSCMAITDLGSVRVRRLMAKYSSATVAHAFEETIRRSEILLRAELEKIPDGVYEWEDAVDDSGVSDRPVKIHTRVTVDGSDVYIDFAGSDPEVRSGINLAPPLRDAYAAVAVRCFTDPDIPHNEGCLRPIHVDAPLGTVMNPNRGAAVAGRAPTVSRMTDCIMACMSQAVPAKAMAGYGGSLLQPVWRGRGEQGEFIFMDTTHGGLGGRRGLDGESCLSFPYDIGNHPIEYVEANYPVEVRNFAIRENSEGPGTFRGGFGAMKTYRLLIDDVEMHVDGDRLKLLPFGLEGGMPSVNQLYVHVAPDGTRTDLASKRGYTFMRGDTIELYTPGGGGLGSPYERDPAAVAADVEQGYIDRERAAGSYGVVVDGEDAVDLDATAALRERVARAEERERLEVA
jgi:N-methylhydantoinase B